MKTSCSLIFLVVGLSGCATIPAPKALEPPTRMDLRRQKAIESFEKTRDDAEFQAASNRHQQNDIAGARQLLEQLLARNPQHHEARLLLAQLALEGNRPDEARAHAQAVLDKTPGNAQAHHTLGMAFDAAGDLHTAMAAYGKAVELAPRNEIFLASYEAAQTAGASKPTTSAQPGWSEGTATDVIGDPADRAKIREQFAAAHDALAAGKRDEARSKLQAALAVRPNDPQLAVSVGVFLIRRNEPDMAATLLTDGARRFPQHAPLLRTLGTAYYRQGDYRASQIALQQALSLDKSSALTYFLLGCTLAKQGQAEAAEGYFRQARQLDPGNAIRR